MRVRSVGVILLAVGFGLSTCTDDGEPDALEDGERVEWQGVSFVVPEGWDVDEDLVAFACMNNRQPGVFLGEGYGFCPVSTEPPAGPSVYVGPYYQHQEEGGLDLVSPDRVPTDVDRPAGMATDEIGGWTVWSDPEEMVLPEVNVVFRFVDVDADLQRAIVGTVEEVG